MFGRRLVDAEALAETIDSLRAALPPELKEALEIQSRSEAIVTKAALTAKHIRAVAESESRVRVDESSIVEQAEAKAEEIVVQAERQAQKLLQQVAMEADSRREEADKYALEVLAKLNGRLEEIQGQLGEFQRVVAGGMEVLRVHQKRSTITQ